MSAQKKRKWQKISVFSIEFIDHFVIFVVDSTVATMWWDNYLPLSFLLVRHLCETGLLSTQSVGIKPDQTGQGAGEGRQMSVSREG